MFFKFTASMRRVRRFCAAGCDATKCWRSSAEFRAAWSAWKRARNAAALVDPEIGVVDATPAQAAGGALAGHLIGRDQETQAPFVATVRDKAEVRAARQG